MYTVAIAIKISRLVLAARSVAQWSEQCTGISQDVYVLSRDLLSTAPGLLKVCHMHPIFH